MLLTFVDGGAAFTADGQPPCGVPHDSVGSVLTCGTGEDGAHALDLAEIPAPRCCLCCWMLTSNKSSKVEPLAATVLWVVLESLGFSLSSVLSVNCCFFTVVDDTLVPEADLSRVAVGTGAPSTSLGSLTRFLPYEFKSYPSGGLAA
jgi:hypothetical protein